MLKKTVFTGLILLALMVGGVQAQEGARDKREYKFEEVTVTAKKEKQKMQDVTAGIDAFSNESIKDAGARSFNELLGYMPNVIGKINFGITRVVIRGVDNPNGSLISPAGFFVDGIPYSIPEMRNIELFDVESLEVLKGPQGTLYGGNSESGVVSVVTKKPVNHFKGSVTGGYGSYNTAHLGAEINAPLEKDKLFLNFAVIGRSSDGVVENINTGQDASELDHKNGRLSLKWLPSRDTRVDVVLNAFKFDDLDGSVRIDKGPGRTERFEINTEGENPNERRGDNQVVKVSCKAGWADLVSITTRNDFTSDYQTDMDLTPYRISDFAMKKELTGYSQEFRLSSPDNTGPLKWLAGVYGENREISKRKHTNLFTGPGMTEDRKTDETANNLAVFGQASYRFYERLRFTAGVRLDHTSMDGEQDYLKRVGGFTRLERFDDSLDNTEVLPKLSVSFDLDQNAMLYASISKGILNGGFNSVVGESLADFTYDPEHMWSYEMGAKTIWLDGRLLANISLFYLDIDDKQVMEGIGLNRRISNAESASSRGLELSIKARPVEGLDFFGGIGYLDAAFDDWQADGYDYEGNSLTFAPEYTFNAGAQYRHATGVFARLDMTGRSSFYTDAKNQYECDGFEIFNARLGYETASWDIVLWCKNLFDKEYIVERRKWSGNSEVVVDGDPLTVGIDLTWRF